MRVVFGTVALFCSIVWTAGCGGPDKPPVRAVIEGDTGGWSFRRYQAVLDIEVWVPKNRAAAHTASYASKKALKRGKLREQDVVNVFVTRYKRDRGIDRALVKFARRLAAEAGYVVEEKKIEGTRLIMIEGGGELWAMWPAKRHIIKVGGLARTSIPEDVVEAYSERYPSRLRSGSLEGELPEGPDEPEPEQEEFDPDNPRPDWDKGRRKSKKKK